MIRSLYAMVFLLFCNGLKAQNIITSDRPDQSDGTETVEKKQLQIETGVEFSKQDELTNALKNMTLIRYGVSKQFEIRLSTEYQQVTDSVKKTGFQPITLSCKNVICQQKGIRPAITLVSYLRLPITFSKDFRGDHPGYSFIAAFMHNLGSTVKFYSNIGIEGDQVSNAVDYPATAEFNIDISKRFSAFIEYFGHYATHNEPENGIDIGFIYAILHNLSIDIAVGTPGGKPSDSRFISFGLSARLPN